MGNIKQIAKGKKKLCCDFQEGIKPAMAGVMNALEERNALAMADIIEPLNDEEIKIINEQCIDIVATLNEIRKVVEIG